MDEKEQAEFYQELESAYSRGGIDYNTYDFLKMSVEIMFNQETTGEEAAYNEKLLDLYNEREELMLKLKLAIIKEKADKGTFKAFHDALLKGTLNTNDPFIFGIFCKKNTKDHKKEIETCKECIKHKECPKRKEFITTPKGVSSYKELVKNFKVRKKLLQTYKLSYEELKNYAASRKYTYKKLSIGHNRFDYYYRTKNMKANEVLKYFLEKSHVPREPK